MTALPDPSDLAPSQNPADYGRRRLFTASFWAMIALCVLCVLAGAAVVLFAPRLLRAPAAPPPAAAPAPPGASSAYGPAPVPATAQAAPGAATPVEARIDRLEAGQGRLVDAAAAALAAAALADAAAQPRPFAEDLAAFERVLPLSAEARALRPLAAAGAPTRTALAAELADLAGRAAVAARAPGRDAGVLDQLSYLISRVIAVRRIDGGGSGADAAIARAQRRAADGDLEGAVAILDDVQGVREPLADWRLRAERRIEIDRHVAGLRAEALAQLAALQRTRAPP